MTWCIHTTKTTVLSMKSEKHVVGRVIGGAITERKHIYRSISRLKLSKSPGKDGLGAEFFKNTEWLMTPILKTLFNKILISGSFPDCWSESIIVPVFKPGNKQDPRNYRGISLINVMYKIFSCIINDQISLWGRNMKLLMNLKQVSEQVILYLITYLAYKVWSKNIFRNEVVDFMFYM